MEPETTILGESEFGKESLEGCILRSQIRAKLKKSLHGILGFKSGAQNARDSTSDLLIFLNKIKIAIAAKVLWDTEY